MYINLGMLGFNGESGTTIHILFASKVQKWYSIETVNVKE